MLVQSSLFLWAVLQVLIPGTDSMPQPTLSEDTCVDISPNCASNEFQCHNYTYVQENCQKTCNLCPKPECPSPWFSIGNQCFLLVVKRNQWLPWSSARTLCDDQVTGADLAQPNDLKALAEYISDNTRHDYWYYLGGSDLGSEGAWSWINGAAITGWREGEPNDKDGEEDCLTMEPHESPNPGNSLIDRDCEGRGPFVCERH